MKNNRFKAGDVEILKGNSRNDLDDDFVNKVSKELETIFEKMDPKNTKVSEEIDKIYNEFNSKILPILKSKEKDAEDYYKRRDEYSRKVVDPVNDKVKKIIDEIKKQYQEKFPNEKIFTNQVASSYSAEMNLIGESDIDYFYLFDGITEEILINISQIFARYGFMFERIGGGKIRENMYYIFNTHVDDIEVDFKVRDVNHSKAVLDLHSFIDNKLDKDLKILFTYAKYQLKLKAKMDKEFKGYNLFKTIFYNYCFKDIDSAFLIIV